MFKEVKRTAALTVASLALALGSQATISRAFGTSSGLDDYWLAYSISMLTAFLVAPLRDALTSETARRIVRDKDAASQYASAFLTSMLPRVVYMVPVLALVAACTQLAGERETLVLMLLAMSIALPFYAATEWLSGLLGAISRPAWQQAFRLLPPLANILAVYALASRLGEMTLIVGFLISNMVASLGIALVLRRCGLRISWATPRFPDFKFWRASSMLALYACVMGGYGVFDKFVFNHLQVGAASAFQYALAATIAVMMLSGQILSATISPAVLHKAHADGLLWAAISRTLMILTAGLLAIMIPIWIGADMLVDVLLAGKNFGLESRTLTTAMLRATLFGALPGSITMVGLRVALFLSAHELIAFNGLIVAITGAAMILLGWTLKSVTLVSLHWLVANVAGATMITLAVRRLCANSSR